jgi:ferrous iron transport protein B
MVLVLNILNSLGTDGSFGRENSDQSVLSQIGRVLTPAFQPMGIQPDNWPATVGIFTGVLAKEAVVGTLDALYSQMAESHAEETQLDFDLLQALLDACQTVPDNLTAIADKLLDPLGIGIANIQDVTAAAEQQEVKIATFGVMQKQFDGQIGAFAYLLFILLYAPCVAATAAIYKETTAAWALFVVAWTTFIAYMTATLFYQGMTFTQHPTTASFWFGLLSLLFAAILALLRYYGFRQQTGVLS